MNRTLPAVIVLSLPLWLAACGGEIEPGRTSATPPTVKGLTLAPVGIAAVAGTQALVGTVESGDRAVIAARTDGRVGRVLVREGATVRAGELLLALEQNIAAARLEAAGSEARAAAARVELADKTFARYARLQRTEAVTPQEMDRVTAERDSARQQLKAAQARQEEARTAAGYSRVVAPFNGRVAQRAVEVGSTVQPGTPLVTLDRDGDWHARLQVPESWLGLIHPGEAMSVEVPALGRTLAGTVAEIIPATDPRSRSFSIKVTLPASDGLSAGLFARAVRSRELGEAVLLPQKAISERGQLTGVYVVEQGMLHFRLVKTGRRLDDRVEILAGLMPGETVVIDGVNRAVNGGRVEP